MNLSPQKSTATVTEIDGIYALVLKERFNPCVLCPGEDECTEKERHDCSLEIRALNEMGAKVGDTVTLALTDDSQIFRAIFYVYGVPMAFLLMGLLSGTGLAQVLGWSLTAQGGLGVLSAALALGVSLKVSRKLDRWALESGKFTPVISAVNPEAFEV